MDPPGTYITVCPISPYLRFGTTGSLERGSGVHHRFVEENSLPCSTSMRRWRKGRGGTHATWIPISGSSYDPPGKPHGSGWHGRSATIP